MYIRVMAFGNILEMLLKQLTVIMAIYRGWNCTCIFSITKVI